MASLNKVFLIGNLTRDPDVRYLPSGTAVADLGLAVNERYKDSKSNEWKEKTTFLEVVVWQRQAETAGEYLSKGSPVFVEGRLQLDEWETKDGEKRSRLRVRADRLQFLGRPSKPQYRDGPDGDAGEARGHAPAPAQETGDGPDEPDDPGPEGDEDNLPF